MSMKEAEQGKQKPNWSIIQAAILGGGEPVEVAKKFNVNINTLYKRMQRHNWRGKTVVLEPEIEKSPTEKRVDKPLDKNLQSLSDIMLQNKEKFLKAGGNVVMKLSSNLETLVDESEGVMDTKAIIAHGVAMESLTRSGKVIFGLNDDSKVNIGVQVQVLSSLDDIPDVKSDEKAV